MEKILIIEDEQALQKALGDILSQEGYQVIQALDGEIGLRLARQERPDLILLDLILPRLDGFGVLGSLKGDKELNSIPVIILTNLEEMENVQKALELGATTYLVKANYTLKDILEKVKTALK